MPYIFDKYQELESALIPLIIEGIKIPLSTVTVKDLVSESTITPRGYPNVTVASTISIECLESDEVAWSKRLASLVEIFKAQGIPIKFGSKEYISVTKHSNPVHSSFKINVNLIDLDRLLEKESKLYKASGNKNTLYETGNPLGIDGSVPYPIIRAIRKTIFEEEGYPIAYLINPSNAFCLTFDADGDEYAANAFRDFYLLFADLCKKHNIKLLPNATEYVISRAVPNSSIVKYEFNIAPADMENLLLSECPGYAGYREGASISRLVDPESADFKDGVICLFPAVLLDNDIYVPRNAGCNMSEIISVQLANYIKKYILVDTDVPKNRFFGHHNSALTEDFLKVDSRHIIDALCKCMSIDSISYKRIDGTIPLSKAATPLITICDLKDNEDALRIYKRLAALTHTELKQLKSCEIPIIDFLNRLIETLQYEIKRLSALNDEREFANEYICKQINQLQAAIPKIDELAAAIKGPSHKMRI